MHRYILTRLCYAFISLMLLSITIFVMEVIASFR